MYPEKFRKAAVAEYFDNGKNATQVAAHYKVHVSTVLRWVEKESGAPVPKKQHRGKYVGKLSVDDVRYSKRAVAKYGIKTTTESVNARRAKRGKGPVCDRTLRRAVQGRKHPMKALLPKKSKPVSAANRQKRIVYCSTKAALAVQNRVYVDSKTFTRATYAGQCKVPSYQYPGKRKVATPLRAQPIKHGYAAVGLDFRTPLIFTELKTVAQIASSKGIKKATVRRKPFNHKDAIAVFKQIRTFCQAHFKGQPYKIVSDNASQHKAGGIKAWFARTRFPLLGGFPPSSPDLNAIENVWSMVDSQLRQMPLGKPSKWEDTLQKAWQKVPQQSINNTVKAMPKRAEMVLAEKGARLSSTHTK
jgi:transposase